MSHRIKNNLQLLSSILSLQASCLDDVVARDSIIECRNRVLAMALIHENLYCEGRCEEVDLLDQLDRLAHSINQSFSWPPVTLKVEGQSVLVSPDIAIYVNLAVNEILTNSFKHAFFGIEDPGLEIEIARREHDLLEIMVADNGRGFPEGVPPPLSDQSLGFRLIQSIAEGQLGGRWTIMKRERGVAHLLSFKLST
jgi:two-component sensor histidine kinase